MCLVILVTFDLSRIVALALSALARAALSTSIGGMRVASNPGTRPSRNRCDAALKRDCAKLPDMRNESAVYLWCLKPVDIRGYCEPL